MFIDLNLSNYMYVKEIFGLSQHNPFSYYVINGNLDKHFCGSLA